VERHAVDDGSLGGLATPNDDLGGSTLPTGDLRTRARVAQHERAPVPGDDVVAPTIDPAVDPAAGNGRHRRPEA
jgi:hypothetical protein